MNLLAIDPGTRCGWASSVNGHVESGVQEFSLGRGDSQGMRFIRFNRWLSEMIAATHPRLIVYERPHLRGGYATDLLVGFSTRIQERCAEAGIECEAVHSGTLKKGVAGSGRADKGAVMRRMSEEFGRPIKDDNEADALGLLWITVRNESHAE